MRLLELLTITLVSPGNLHHLKSPPSMGGGSEKLKQREFAMQLAGTSPKGFHFPFANFAAHLTSGRALWLINSLWVLRSFLYILWASSPHQEMAQFGRNSCETWQLLLEWVYLRDRPLGSWQISISYENQDFRIPGSALTNPSTEDENNGGKAESPPAVWNLCQKSEVFCHCDP